MILKYHAEVTNLKEAVTYYADLFKGTIVKDGSIGGHGFVKLYDQIQFTLHGNNREVEKTGELVLRFQDGESQLMDDLIARVHEDKDEKVRYELRSFPWGTELFSFVDKYGYTWTLER